MFLGFSSYTLSEENNVRVFENGMPRRILGLKREEVRKGTYITRNLYNSYASVNIIRVLK
jgi:hypothetical protein